MRKRHKHNLSHYRLATANAGELIPVGCVEVLPGDSFRHTASVLVRFSPLLAPVMHRAIVRLHHFYVPNRITWPITENGGWEGFMTQAPNVTTVQVPSVTINNADLGTALVRLYEHLGAPLRTLGAPSGSLKLSQLPVRAYWAIWNEYYRDQDLQTEQDIDDFSTLGNGIKKVCWRKDMFTAARTSTQLGANISLPIGTTAPVVVNQVSLSSTGSGVLEPLGVKADNHATLPNVLFRAGSEQHGDDTSSSMVGTADLSSATGVTINQFRESLALQRYAERLQQFGHRYPEVLLSGFGVKSKDGRLQRPEYLGGGKVNVSFSEVMQTSNGATPPGNTVGALYGHGIAPGRTSRYTRFFEDYGYVISVLSVVPEAVYSQAIPRHFFKGFSGGLNNARYIDDYYQPELERIGEAAILNKEVYPDGDSSDDAVFGYNAQYYEYQHQLSQVAGDFVPGDILDEYTWARSFPSQPPLNATFVNCDPGKRIFADQGASSENLWIVVNHDLRARRVVSKFARSRIL